jgi:hypothetical protein
MKQFKGNRPYKEIKKLLKEKGFDVDEKAYNEVGSDFRCFTNGLIENTIITCISYGCFGQFYIKYFDENNKERTASYLSENLDNEKWYSELLDILYLPQD